MELAGEVPLPGSSVGRAAVGCSQHEDDALVVINLVEEAPRADAIAPGLLMQCEDSRSAITRSASRMRWEVSPEGTNSETGADPAPFYELRRDKSGRGSGSGGECYWRGA